MTIPGSLFAQGIENLRMADGSIMPRVSTGQHDGTCIVIGERAGEMLKKDHSI